MKIQAVVFDWAGTTVDHGSRAPVAVLLEVFANHGVEITVEEARAAMGLLKKDHIRSICAGASVAARWAARQGAPPCEADVERLFAEFIPLQMACLERYSDVLPGVVEVVDRLRRRGIKIGSTTGYTRPMLDLLMGKAATQGYSPDAAVCPDDAGGGRPAPWMCYLNAIRLKVFPLEACVKIGDTPSDIAEGRNAGMWTVGIARTGNEIGLAQDEFAALSPPAQQERLTLARQRLSAAGAHFVADSVAECEEVLERLETQTANR